MKGSLVPCGHTFSDFQIYDEKTAKEECIKMVRNIMEYWKYHVVIHLVISRFMMRRLQRKNVSKWLEILWNIGKQRRQELNRNKFYKKKVLFEI